ncbi:LytR/AlgR family response regulator transcription factor [Carboxylicivirga linearis]|uniref:Response regulator transcription factor n=1 Tax=Carboxylicivirga linearis TaxID=1628157 RepID=A0ABS5JZT9_9BACT|nr:LytTR family DNA-binding domain-containing protein [Carboxylicivirga linearis]MBS2099931.1 response regulator transcription factor [Carboxylicivirga linearis]
MEQIINALVVEDIQDTSDYICQRIQQLFPQIKKVNQAYDIEEAYDIIKRENIQLVFLDIQLTTGTGFDLLKKLSEENCIDFEIIFITGESAKEYTLRAIKYSAIDFLYKPLDDSELVQAVNKALSKISSRNFNHQIKLLLERVGGAQQIPSNKMAFHLHNGIIEFVNISDIVYLKADGVICYVFLKDGVQLSVTRNIGFYKEMLVSDYHFHAISNSLLVNQEFIKKYNHRELTVELTNGTVLYASKRFGKDFKDQFGKKGGINSFTRTIRQLFGR